MTIKKMIIDADILLFQSAASVEHEAQWPDGLWTWHAYENEADAALDDMVKGLYLAITEKHPECNEVIMALSGDRSKNFRKLLLPTYKSNRKGSRKPLLYKYLEARMRREYDCAVYDTLEGDDVLGLLAAEDTILVTIDKDLKTVAGNHYNFNKKEFFTIDADEADYWNMYQALTGDTTDGYAGIPGVGPVAAAKVLEEYDPSQWFDKAYSLALKKGLDEQYVQRQYAVAHILRPGEYDFETGEIKGPAKDFDLF